MSSVPPGPAESVASSPPRGTTPDGNTNTRKYPRANRLAVDPSTPYYYLRCCCCCYLPLLILLLLLPYYRYQYLFTFIDYFGGDFVVDSRESVCQEVVDIYGVGCVCRCECRIHKNEDWRARPTLANDGPIISHACVMSRRTPSRNLIGPLRPWIFVQLKQNKAQAQDFLLESKV